MNALGNKYHQNGIYYVGQTEVTKNIHCNSYLLIENEQAILFEPGSVIDFEQVLQNVIKIIPLEKIDYVFMSHPDPDLASSLPLFEKEGLDAKIICDWKTFEILYFYGIKSPSYLIREHDYKFVFDTGRVIRFIPAPFTHYSGNVIAYDETYHILFSGDLFGGFSKDWQLYAGEDYNEAMATYHENYMPSSDFIKPVMKKLLSLKINTILPQHGSIIQNEDVQKSILFLYKLNFYNNSYAVTSVVNNRRNYNFEVLLQQMLMRLRNLFSDAEILEVFKNSTIEIDPITFEIISTHESKYRLWNQFFFTIYEKKGIHWLSFLETLVNKVTNIYHIKKPEIYDSKIANNQIVVAEMVKEKEQMLTKIEKLQVIQNKNEDKLTRCPITNLRYTSSLKELLMKDLSEDFSLRGTSGVILVTVDRIEEINAKYTSQIGDETLKIVALKIQEIVGSKVLVFKHTGPSFYVYVPNIQYADIKSLASNIRNDIAQSNSFVKPVTVSISITDFSEIVSIEPADQVDEIFTVLNKRMIQAESYGGGHIIDQNPDFKSYDGHVLLIDEDDINRNILLRIFNYVNIEVIIATDVYEAFSILEKISIDVIISEINLSKMDGFSLKRRLNEDDKYGKIPFILVSHNKNHDSILKANQLEVDYILQKPFYPEEIIGIVQRIKKRERIDV